MMAEEEYAGYLDLIDEGGADSAEEMGSGKTYSDAALLLTKYKGALRRYGSERM